MVMWMETDRGAGDKQIGRLITPVNTASREESMGIIEGLGEIVHARIMTRMTLSIIPTMSLASASIRPNRLRTTNARLAGNYWD
jgi:hypothetical protein